MAGCESGQGLRVHHLGASCQSSLVCQVGIQDSAFLSFLQLVALVVCQGLCRSVAKVVYERRRYYRHP